MSGPGEGPMIEHVPPKPFPPTSLVGVNVPTDLNKVIIETAAKNGICYEDQLLKFAMFGYEVDLRFFEKVDKHGPVPECRPELGSCWIWHAAIDPHGYGRFNIGGNKLAHRISYSLAGFNIPDGLDLDHLCRVRNCVRPSHLEPVTNAQNSARSFRATKTHCARGHRLDGENLYRRPDGGGRQCQECKRDTKRRFDIRKNQGDKK